jgi:hypothetical protein
MYNKPVSGACIINQIMAVIISDGIGKHTSFLHYELNYGHNLLYDTGPRVRFVVNISQLAKC